MDLCVILYSTESDPVCLIGQDGGLGQNSYFKTRFLRVRHYGSYVPGLTRVSLAATARSCDRVHPPQPAVAAYLEYDSLAEILLPTATWSTSGQLEAPRNVRGIIAEEKQRGGSNLAF